MTVIGALSHEFNWGHMEEKCKGGVSFDNKESLNGYLHV